jgi:hypothetical protein
MIVLNDEQIDFIRDEISRNELYINGLSESLIDHICCAIENSEENDFNTAYHSVLQSFGCYGFEQIQSDIIYLLNHKNEVIMKKLMFILGYLSVIMCSTGLLFKVQHWPGASIVLLVGVVLLNFGFLPIFFYDKYKAVKD